MVKVSKLIWKNELYRKADINSNYESSEKWVKTFFIFWNIHLVLHRAHQSIKIIKFLENYRCFFSKFSKELFSFNIEFDLKNFFHFFGLHHFINQLNSNLGKKDFQQKIIRDLLWNYSSFINSIFDDYEKNNRLYQMKIYWKIDYSYFSEEKNLERSQLAYIFFFYFLKIFIKNIDKVKIKGVLFQDTIISIEVDFFSRLSSLNKCSFLKERYSKISSSEESKIYFVFSLKINEKNIIVLGRKEEYPTHLGDEWKWINFISITSLSKKDLDEWEKCSKLITKRNMFLYLDKIAPKNKKNEEERCNFCNSSAINIKEISRLYLCTNCNEHFNDKCPRIIF